MNQACIDTHALVWYLSRPKRLGRAAARLLRAADAGRAEILVPAIVLIELTLLREAGRNVVGVPQVEALFARYEQRSKDSRARLLELHFQMIRLTSAQEWPAIGKVEADMLQATIAVPR